MMSDDGRARAAALCGVSTLVSRWGPNFSGDIDRCATCETLMRLHLDRVP